jgi:hypothetical protein
MNPRDFDNKNAAHGAGTPGRSTEEEMPSMAAGEKLPISEMIRERERVDAMGRLLFPGLPDPVERLDGHVDLDPVTRERIGMGVSPLAIAAERLEEARMSLREAMKFIDCTEHRDLHLRLGNEVNSQDDLRAVLMERCS